MVEKEVPPALDAYLSRPAMAIFAPHFIAVWLIGEPIASAISFEAAMRWREELLLPIRAAFTVPIGTECELIRN